MRSYTLWSHINTHTTPPPTHSHPYQCDKIPYCSELFQVLYSPGTLYCPYIWGHQREMQRHMYSIRQLRDNWALRTPISLNPQLRFIVVWHLHMTTVNRPREEVKIKLRSPYNILSNEIKTALASIWDDLNDVQMWLIGLFMICMMNNPSTYFVFHTALRKLGNNIL